MKKPERIVFVRRRPASFTFSSSDKKRPMRILSHEAGRLVVEVGQSAKRTVRSLRSLSAVFSQLAAAGRLQLTLQEINKRVVALPAPRITLHGLGAGSALYLDGVKIGTLAGPIQVEPSPKCYYPDSSEAQSHTFTGHIPAFKLVHCPIVG